MQYIFDPERPISRRVASDATLKLFGFIELNAHAFVLLVRSSYVKSIAFLL